VRFRNRFVLPAILLFVFLLGCKSSDNPATPPTPSESVGVQAYSVPHSSRDENRYLWGYSEIFIDPESCEYEMVPVRQVADHWNVLRFLEQGPCTSCFKVKGVTPTPKGTLQVSVEIRHPFPAAELTGFDVRGIAMSYGTHYFPVAKFVTSARAQGQGELVNADGYTTLYNPNTWGAGPGGLQGYIQGTRATIPYPNTTLNGFKRHSSSVPGNTRNAFYAGDSITRVYEIFKPSGAFILGYAVDACWVPATTKPVTDPITDFPPEANCPEPWRIEITEHPVDLGLTSQGGETVLTIDVYDYQGKLSHYVPTLECPEIFDGLIYAVYKSTASGYARFEATVSNGKLAPNGLYKCLVAVRDLEDETAPEWLNLTAYNIIELGVGAQAPPNVTGFQASDGDPSLPNRRIELTWDALSDTVEFYDIERLDYEWPGGWYWKEVKSAPHSETSWIDGNPRYCGPGDPIQYRISARNAAGSSPGYDTDTGYPLMRGFNMAIWCVADDASGSNPVASWDRAGSDFNNCRAFWNRYGMDFVLKNSGGFFWVGNPAYKSLSGDEAGPMHEAYGQAQHPDSINVYYVDQADGDPGKAYTAAMCPAEFHDTEHIMIIVSRDTGGSLLPITLAHECGHAIGRFWDVYLLDTNHNLILDDGTTCASENTWCNTPPYNDPLFCDPRAAYQQNPNAGDKNPWNLMWYSYQGKPVANYNLYDSQYIWLHDWVNTYKSNYPWP